LLDTHAFLWAVSFPDKLSSNATDIIQNPENILFLSAASGWEIAIKCAIKKLDIPGNPADFVRTQMKITGITELPISMVHSLQTFDMPPHHKDPFDRMIVAQSLCEKLPIITCDIHICKYKVLTIW
jgi:PIN domain nuclease of toxin-antitoxin system